MPEAMSPRKVELKPCSFCGGAHLKFMKVFSEDEPTFQIAWKVFCEVCHANGPAAVRIGWCETERDAADAWNRRAALASSGDHAELARWIDDYERDAAIDAAEDGDLSHVDDGLREFPMRRVKALIAEVEALREQHEADMAEVARAGQNLQSQRTALIAKLVGYAAHDDDDCTANRYPGHEACSCGLSAVLQEARHVLSLPIPAGEA